MNVIDQLIGDVALPQMLRVRQIFDDSEITDIAAAVADEFARMDGKTGIKPGMSIALGVGSRGLANLPDLVRETVAQIRALGAQPFIVPAMGSHGGASAEGQEQLLAGLGVTEDSVGCPIRSSMEVVELGRLPNGLPVYMDALAMQADGIAVINRVKPHTSFSADIESGLTKMITIGLGKQRGAESCHAYGFGQMAQNVVDMSGFSLSRAPILFGIASIENAYDKLRHIELVPAADILSREPDLLRLARANMPRVLFDPVDVLVVDRMGKEYSGTGMDPNITGRAGTPYLRTAQTVGKLAVLDLSTKSGGNATGVGLADICTQRLVDKIDREATYANCITSTVLISARIPVVMANDRQALQLAIKTCNAPDPAAPRVVRLSNTLHMETILISQALAPLAREHPQLQILSDAAPMGFDDDGNLPPF